MSLAHSDLQITVGEVITSSLLVILQTMLLLGHISQQKAGYRRLVDCCARLLVQTVNELRVQT